MRYGKYTPVGKENVCSLCETGAILYITTTLSSACTCTVGREWLPYAGNESFCPYITAIEKKHAKKFNVLK